MSPNGTPSRRFESGFGNSIRNERKACRQQRTTAYEGPSSPRNPAHLRRYPGSHPFPAKTQRPAAYQRTCASDDGTSERRQQQGRSSTSHDDNDDDDDDDELHPPRKRIAQASASSGPPTARGMGGREVAEKITSITMRLQHGKVIRPRFELSSSHSQLPDRKKSRTTKLYSVGLPKEREKGKESGKRHWGGFETVLTNAKISKREPLCNPESGNNHLFFL